MEHGKRLVFRHVDLVQNAETAVFRTLIYGAVAKGYLPVLKGVCSDQGGRVGIQIKRNIPLGPTENGGKVFCQNVFARGLGTHKEQILPGKQGGQSLFPYILSVIMVFRCGNTPGHFPTDRVRLTKIFDFFNNLSVDSLLL